MKLAILRTVRWRIGDAVLVAKECGNLLKDPGNLAIELRKPGVASRQLSKRLQLIFCLEVGQARTRSATQFAHVVERFVEADSKNADITLTQRLQGLIERVLGKRIDATRQQQNGFLAFDILQAVIGLQNRVEDVRFAKAGKIEVVNGIANFLFVLRKVDFETRL